MPTPFSLSQAMKQLEEINRWFQQDDLDLELALQKLKEAKGLLNQSQARLQEVENEFRSIKADLVEKDTDQVED